METFTGAPAIHLLVLAGRMSLLPGGALDPSAVSGDPPETSSVDVHAEESFPGSEVPIAFDAV